MSIAMTQPNSTINTRILDSRFDHATSRRIHPVSILFVYLAAVVATSGCGPSHVVVEHSYDTTKSDKENLLGEWVCVESVKGGATVAERIGKAMRFNADDTVYQMKVPKNSEWITSGYLLETDLEPKRLLINATPVGSVMPQGWWYLYRFENGGLTLYGGELNSAPLDFDDDSGQFAREVFKRVE